MEIEATPTADLNAVPVSVGSGVAAHADGFGTRPLTDRPHSTNLFGAERSSRRNGASRGLDVLVGAGIGAAVMYYLDPDGGARRRAVVRDVVLDVVTMAPDAVDAGNRTPGARLVASAVGAMLTLLAARRRNALGATLGLVGSALLARAVTKTPLGRGKGQR
jgi:hypothetical protein